MIREEAAVVYIKVSAQHSPRWTEEIQVSLYLRLVKILVRPATI
jgi:hypothetical protein